MRNSLIPLIILGMSVVSCGGASKHTSSSENSDSTPAVSLAQSEPTNDHTGIDVEDLKAKWEKILADSRMSFEIPPGYEILSVVENEHFGYQFAIKSISGKVEYRYRINSLKEQLERFDHCEESAECTAVDPNSEKSSAANFFAVVMNLNGGNPQIPMQQFPHPDVQNEFNAHRGLTTSFTPIETFSKFKQSSIFQIHRDDMAEAYAVALFDDFGDQQTIQEYLSAFHALRFIDKIE